MSAPFSCMCVAMQWRSRVAGSALAGLRRVDAFLDHVGQMVAAERLAVRSKERREVVRLDGKLGPRLGDVLAQPRRRPLSDRHVTVLLALALVDEDQAAVKRQIEEFQAHHFQTPQAGRIDRFEDGAVPESDWVIDLAQRHDPLDLFDGEDGLGQSAAQPGQVDLRRRVMQDVILPRHPSEPHAQGHKPRVLAAEGQRLPVLFAVEEQVPLIAFQHWAA